MNKEETFEDEEEWVESGWIGDGIYFPGHKMDHNYVCLVQNILISMNLKF